MPSVTLRPTAVAAGDVEVQGAALVARLAGHVLQLGHVRHVADGHAAIVEEGDHPIDLELGDVIARRAQRELGRDIDRAVAHVGERPLRGRPAANSSGQ